MRLHSLLPSIFICISSQAYAEENHQAHVHGEAEMTMILQGNELAINFESPAANIVGFEHQPETDQQHNAIEAALLDLQDPSSWLQFDGSNCSLLSSTANTNLRSDHDNHADEDHADHEDEEHADHEDEEHADHEGEEHADHEDEEHANHEGEEHADHEGEEHADHEGEEHADHEGEEHANHEGEEHADHEGEEHADHEDEEHANHNNESHTEFTAHYLYDCQQGDNLESVFITLQSKYSSIEHIEVQWIINGNQGVTELENGKQSVSLK